MKYNISYLNFGEIAKFKYGVMPKKNKIIDEGSYPIYSGYKYVGRYPEYNLDANQLIVVARGVGGTGDVKITKEKVFLTNLSIAIFVDESIVLKKYLYYLYQINNLRYLDSGSAQSQITISDLERVKVPVIPIKSQKALVSILDSINNKIELNNKINDNLKHQSLIIFNDFYNSINCEEIAFKDDSDFGKLIMGQSPEGESYNTKKIGFPLLNGAADYNNMILTPLKYTSSPTRLCEIGDLIFCIRATIGLLVFADKKYCLGRGVAAISKTNSVYTEYIYHIINRSIEKLKCQANGSVIVGINKDDILKIKIKKPTNTEIEEFHKKQKPIFEMIENSRKEIQILSDLRDTILPKLMSGEIDVSNIKIEA